MADMRWKEEREEIVDLIYRIQADHGGSLLEREARKTGPWAVDAIKRARKIRWISSKGSPPVLSVTNKGSKALDTALASRAVPPGPVPLPFGGSVVPVETEYGGPVVLPLSYEPYTELKEWALKQGTLTQEDIDRVANSPRMEHQEPGKYRAFNEEVFPGTRGYAIPLQYEDGHLLGGGLLRPDGYEGPYQVIVTLTRRGASDVPGMYMTDAYAMEGDSHLYLPERRREGGATEVLSLIYTTQEGQHKQFELLPNQRGRLGQVRTVLRAKGASDARRAAYRLLNPFLCDLSYRYDVPMDILQWNTVELATLTLNGTKQDDFRERMFQPEGFFGTGFSYEGLPLYEFFTRLYREGVNSSSMDYGFLCFFRIVEGVMKLRRKRINELEGRKVSLEEVFLNEEIVEGGEANVFPTELQGESLRVAVKKLYEQRDKVAHAFLNREDPVAGHADIIANRLEDEEHAATRRAQARYVARRMLDSEFFSE